jgi:hypothetical protein
MANALPLVVAMLIAKLGLKLPIARHNKFAIV